VLDSNGQGLTLYGRLGASPAARRIARNAVVRSTSEIVAKLASLAFFVVMARELGTDGFGDFMFALTLTTVLVTASGFGTEDLVAREVARDRGAVHRLLSDVVAIKALTSIALLLVAVAIVHLGGYPTDTRLAVYLVGLGVAIENLGRTWYAVFQAHERLELVAGAVVLQRIATAAVGIAVLLGGGGLVAASAVFLGGSLVGLVAAHLLLRRHVVDPAWRTDRSRWLAVLRLGVPIGLAGILFTLVLKLDLLMLSFLRGGEQADAEVGSYGAALRVIEATMFLSWGFGTAVLPWFSRHGGGGAVSLARAFGLGLKALTAVLLPIAALFSVLAAPLVELLYGDGYEDAVVPLRLLGPVTALFAINTLAVTVLIARNRPSDFTRVLAVVVAVNIGLNAMLIPVYGADGAAFSALASATLLAVLSMRRVAALVGEVPAVRSLGAPVAAGLVMVAAMLVFPGGALGAASLGIACYAAALIAVEWVAFGQADLVLAAGLARGRPVGGTSA
jgi:O-antigen/teichoic acid export membrane protein